MFLPLPRKCTAQEFTYTNKHCVTKDRLCDFFLAAILIIQMRLLSFVLIPGDAMSLNLTFVPQSRLRLWILKARSIRATGRESAADHTLANSSGHAIFIKSLFPQQPMKAAKTSSPVINKRSKNCKIFLIITCAEEIDVGALNLMQASISK